MNEEKNKCCCTGESHSHEHTHDGVTHTHDHKHEGEQTASDRPCASFLDGHAFCSILT